MDGGGADADEPTGGTGPRGDEKRGIEGEGEGEEVAKEEVEEEGEEEQDEG